MKTNLIQKLVVVFLFVSSTIPAQLETSQWRFGSGCGLDLTTNPPTNVSSLTYSSNFSTASVADANGNLLFYTNGINVWTKTHTVMVNGSGLLGTPIDNALIIQQPGNGSLYYIFYVNSNVVSTSSCGLYYAVVDMSQSGGFGAVLTKNNIMYLGPTPQKITGTKHCNGNDFWVLIKDCYNNNNCLWNGYYNFYAYQLTATGVNTTAVISSYTYAAPGAMAGSKFGQMKISPNGKKLAVGNYNFCAQYSPLGVSMELYDFNNSTGQVSNFINLLNAPVPGNGNSNIPCPGVEFSPDGSKLYGTLSDNHHYPNGSMLQWDLCAGDQSAIIASQTSLAVNSYTAVNGFGGLQLAPNGKIYAIPYGGPPSASTQISVINNPNAAGAACNFSFYVQSMAPGYLNWFFPNFMGSQFFLANSVSAFSLALASSTVGCQTIQFQAPLNVGATVGTCIVNTYTLQSLSWDFGDSISGSANTSTLNNPVHTFSTTGVHTIKLYLDFGCGAGSTILTQTINVASPVFGNLIHTSSLTCFGATTGTAGYTGQQGGGFTYTFTNGASSYPGPPFTNLGTGTYTVIAYHFSSGCLSNTVFSITQPSAITVALQPTICQNTNIQAQVSGGTAPYSYIWPNGSNSAIGSSSVTGTNTVAITDANSCTVMPTFLVYPTPTIIALQSTVCLNASVQAQVSGGTAPYTYTWPNGSNSAVGSSSVLGTNTLVVTDANACSTMSTFSVYPTPIISVSGQTLCAGSVATVQANGASSYTWTGGTTGSQLVYSSAIPGAFGFTVTGQNASGCSDANSCVLYFMKCTSLSELENHPQPTVYPNPTSGELFFSEDNVQYTVYNSIGQNLQHGQSGERILLSEPGVYYVCVYQKEKQTAVYKVIVMR
jgi:hypothetical protein